MRGKKLFVDMFLRSFGIPVTSVVLIKSSANNGSPFKDYL